MSRKLYRLTSEKLEIPWFFDDGQIYMSDASSIPMLRYPDGSWCHYSNNYMYSLFKRGLSRKNGGGTLKAYAANISHLLRYCYSNNIDLPQMTDARFSMFIRALSDFNTTFSSSETRSKNSVINIGRNCLGLLSHVGKMRFDDNFVSANGAIKGEQKLVNIRNKDKGITFSKSYWFHRSFPSPSPLKKRFPISEGNMKKLTIAAAETEDVFIRKRRFAMLRLLESTGCRRSELVGLKVKSVYSALAEHPHLLRMPTSKAGGNRSSARLVPVSKTDLKLLENYITYNRAPLVKKLGIEDHGTLFISSTTGKALLANTVTQEISTLSKYSGITERTSPHMFRHRFITQYFIMLIKQHDLKNIDDCRRLMINTGALKQQIQQITGHKLLSSLDVYIDLAFAELTNHVEVLDSATKDMKLSSLQRTLQMMKIELSASKREKGLVELLEVIADELNDLL
ncbi:tyrosine-type recombinase/integrase [Pseudomonas sp. EKM23D]|uniref:tyrosine-type recombinase/integrase n=1 Tax=Pseudomonas sp. EKM23D TaxID=2708062 RepID=UPI00142DD349|nr:site-specific integrase [Pseudomonas sp. EKM23D]KAF6693338.1 tyrosine-type recombinase/integrase [Pseudomonas sp. EKM23D]